MHACMHAPDCKQVLKLLQEGPQALSVNLTPRHIPGQLHTRARTRARTRVRALLLPADVYILILFFSFKRVREVFQKKNDSDCFLSLCFSLSVSLSLFLSFVPSPFLHPHALSQMVLGRRRQQGILRRLQSAREITSEPQTIITERMLRERESDQGSGTE